MEGSQVLQWQLPMAYAVTDRTVTTAYWDTNALCKEGAALVHDAPWEGDHCIYHNFFFDDGIYRMYYLAHNSKNPYTEIKICYAESMDGTHWQKPSLGLCEFGGSKDNNILLDKTVLDPDGFFDNFFVFKDSNPTCKPLQKYKALAYLHPYKLSCYFSSDGLRFSYGYEIGIPGRFDSLNVCFWDEREKAYTAYIRDFHDIPESGDLNQGIRDIRRTQSADFISWTTPVPIAFGPDAPDIPLYTNLIMPYCRNAGLYLGFPTRYVERKEWTPYFDRLCGREKRLERMKEHPRLGLAVTDCIFMVSSDGQNWQRTEEALIAPGEERPDNWVYGDCYPAYGMIQRQDANGHERLWMFMPEGHNGGGISVLNRYSIRADGFTCCRADGQERVLITKPFVFAGEELYLNFATAAAGYIYVTLRGEGAEATSFEIFGNSTRRMVSFESGALTALRGRIVTATFKMREARLYAYAVG